MTIIIVLISISLVIAIGFLISFLWNMRHGQYDDLSSPAVRMLFENKPRKTEQKKPEKKRDSVQVS